MIQLAFPMRTFSIGNKHIGKNCPCFIIAEAGVNHNGDMEQAKLLIDAAQSAGADAVKFQTFITEKVVTKTTGKAPYQKRTTGDGSYYDMIKPLEFNKEQFAELKNYAEKKDILFFSTPAEEDSIDLLYDLGVPFFKVDSANLTNLPYIRHMATKGLPMIISTGMAWLGEIEETIEEIKKVDEELPFVLLHCTSDYPPEVSTVHINAIKTLQMAFNVPIGYSDHTPGIEVAVAAVALGAKIIEKHLTLDKTLPGPDQEASLEPDEFRQLVQSIRNVERALGSTMKKPTRQEKTHAEVFRKSIVSTQLIRKGEPIVREMLTVKRPGNGLPAKYIPWLVGRKPIKDIPRDEVILLDHFIDK
jgi:N-acetylneuraminate synthase